VRVLNKFAKEVGIDKAFSYVPKPQYPSERLALNVNAENAVRDMTGVTLTNEGQAAYSGMSGTQTSLLQNAGSIYSRSEINSLLDVYKQIGEMVLDFIDRFMDYPHYVRVINVQGEPEMALINDPYYTSLRYDRDRTFVEPQFIDTLMAERVMELNTQLGLFDRGIVDSLSVLEKTNDPNPVKTRDRARYEKGVLQAFAEEQARQSEMQGAIEQQDMQEQVNAVRNG